MKSSCLYTILALCGFAVMPSFEMSISGGGPRGEGTRRPRTTASITITDINDNIVNVNGLYIRDDGRPTEGVTGKFQVNVKRATVESKETVKCFFARRLYQAYFIDFNDSLLSPLFSPTEEFAEPFHRAAYLYCYDSDAYNNNNNNNLIKEGDAADDDDDDAVAATASTSSATTAALFTLYLDSALGPIREQENIVQVTVPAGQVYGSTDLFSGVNRLTYVKRAVVVDASSDQKVAVEPGFAAADNAMLSSGDASNRSKNAVCYIELYPSGISPLPLGAEAEFDGPQILRGVTCFRAGHTEYDFESVRRAKFRWTE